MSAPAVITTRIVRAINLTIPGWAPSKSNSYRIGTTKAGTPFLFKGSPGRTGDAVKDFELAAQAACITNRVDPFEGDVTVEAMVYAPNMRCDIPGVEKVLLDSLQNWRWKTVRGKRTKFVNVGGYGCYLNDSQVKRFVVDFGGLDPVNPRIVVTVKPWVRP